MKVLDKPHHADATSATISLRNNMTPTGSALIVNCTCVTLEYKRLTVTESTTGRDWKSQATVGLSKRLPVAIDTVTYAYI